MWYHKTDKKELINWNWLDPSHFCTLSPPAREKKRCYKIPESTTLAVLAFHSKAHTSISKVSLAFEIWVFLSLICSGHHSQTEMEILWYHLEFYRVSLASAMQRWEQRFLLKISLPGGKKKVLLSNELCALPPSALSLPHEVTRTEESTGYGTMQIHHSNSDGDWERKALPVPKTALPLLSVAHMDGLSSAHLSTRFLPPGAGEPQAGVTTQHFSIGEQRIPSALWDALMHVQKHRCGSGRTFLFLILVKYLQERGTSSQYIRH